MPGAAGSSDSIVACPVDCVLVYGSGAGIVIALAKSSFAGGGKAAVAHTGPPSLIAASYASTRHVVTPFAASRTGTPVSLRRASRSADGSKGSS